MVSTYENVPVFRSGTGFGSANGPSDIIGKAKVETNEETGKVFITIESMTDNLPRFLDLGKLQAFELNTFVNHVDREKQKEYWSQQP